MVRIAEDVRALEADVTGTLTTSSTPPVLEKPASVVHGARPRAFDGRRRGAGRAPAARAAGRWGPYDQQIGAGLLLVIDAIGFMRRRIADLDDRLELGQVRRSAAPCA